MRLYLRHWAQTRHLIAESCRNVIVYWREMDIYIHVLACLMHNICMYMYVCQSVRLSSDVYLDDKFDFRPT